jgi:hypothetical protein
MYVVGDVAFDSTVICEHGSAPLGSEENYNGISIGSKSVTRLTTIT